MGNNNLDQNSNGKPSSEKRPPAFTLLKEPVVFGEEEGDVHKFEVGRGEGGPVGGPAFENLGELPATYHEKVLFLTARDPRWLFAYWDFDWAPYLPSAFRGGVRQFYLSVLTQEGVEEALVEIK
ncbi:MAG TPA: hypothetical protein VEO95_06450, partial [Chthoniobacteraceae bacterium]|nr:hypothetical protein [Chthoniobacteraceae bacterium]